MRTDTVYSKTFGKIILFSALAIIGFTVGCDRDPGGLLQGAGPTGPAGPPPNLGTISTYGIISYNAMTGSASTHIYGDVALIASDSMVGFAIVGNPPTSPYVTGQINTQTLGNPAVTVKAQADLHAAYLDLSSRTPTTFFPTAAATELSGKVLTPGVYQVFSIASQTLALSNIAGPLVLDGGGSPDSVFVFQASDITTTTGSVVLRNGARAANVFWVMTASATIGVNTFFQGTIVAGGTITVNAGANVEGRMLAGALGASAITVGGAVIAVPAP